MTGEGLLDQQADRLLLHLLAVEASLARAQASLPENVRRVQPAQAESISRVCQALMADPAPLDPEALRAQALSAGNLAIPFVKALTAQVARVDAHAARVVHLGATSQDILDTAAVLVWRENLEALEQDLEALLAQLAALALAYRDTPMMGRTWMQHALPISLGLKVAGWLDALLRHAERLAQMRERVCVLQFGGAAGTLASLGETALPVHAALARDLGLAEPHLAWFAHRDRVFELASVLAGLCGTLGKIARDVSLMSQTEVGEVYEAPAPGKGGSSTMPHKRNPVGCAAVLTQAAVVPGLIASLAAALPQEHERALGGWQAEWSLMPQLWAATRLALGQGLELVAGLQIDTHALRANIDRTRGLVMAESVALALAPAIGKAAAHTLLEEACRKVLDEGRSLHEVLAATPQVLAHLPAAELAKRLDPQGYLGASGAFVDRVLAAYQGREGRAHPA